eukprot:GHVR01087594.1.p1 GENE.GHVR01087594.1~~GHVR01087594.1.p1  ORF type:complete len:215 (+),score=63.53 GHVR01087594.1:381-1025(+)
MWLPFFMTEHLGHAPHNAAFSSVFFDVGGIFGAVSAGYISDRVFHGRRMFCAMVLCIFTGFAVLLFLWASHQGTVLLLFSMTTLGFAIAGPDALLGGTAAQDLCERAGVSCVSRVSGVVNGLGSVGAVVQGIIVAYVSEAFGWVAVFATLCMFSVAAVLVMFTAVSAESQTYTQLHGCSERAENMPTVTHTHSATVTHTHSATVTFKEDEKTNR